MAKGVCYDTHIVGVDIRELLGLDGGRLVKMASARFRESSVRKREVTEQDIQCPLRDGIQGHTLTH